MSADVPTKERAQAGAPAATRRLILLRHAKAAWPDVPDEQRPLADRGERDASEAGRVLRARGLRPQLVLCSTATRTRQTWQLAAAQLDAAPQPRHTERVYQATVSDLLELVRQAPADVTELLLVGHNPGMQGLTLTLADRAVADPEARSGPVNSSLLRARVSFPTASIAVLAFAGPWSGLAPGAADLVELITPRA
jgi:phosphohistidine phosphatase